MSDSHISSGRFVFPALKVAALSVKVALQHLEHIAARLSNALASRTALPEVYSSRRACPECGGPMFYYPTSWSALTGRYLRACENCDYDDARPVKIVEQL